MAKATQELTYGTFDFGSMDKGELDTLLGFLIPNFDPSVDSIARKRLDAHALCKRHELEDMDAVEAYAQEKVKAKLKDVPDDYKELVDDRERVEELLDKAKCRVKLENYGDNETHKLVGILYRAVESRFDGLSLEEFEALEITSAARGRTIPVVFEDEIPTTEPDGVSERVKELMEAIAAHEEENDRTAPIFGRNEGERPWGMMQLSDGTRIRISLPDNYKVQSE